MDTPKETGIDLNQKAINAQNFLYELGSPKSCVIIFLLDCCRAHYQDTLQVDKLDPNSSDARLADFEEMNCAGALIAFACAPGSIAIDTVDRIESKNGFFTKYLLDHITTPHEEIRTILSDVRKRMIQESKSKQIPFVSDGLLQNDICLNGSLRCELHI